MCLVKLEPQTWGNTDSRWSLEIIRAEKALMGVYSADVQIEAIFVHLVYFSKNDDYRKLYLESLAKMPWDADLMAAGKSFLLALRPSKSLPEREPR